MPGIVDADCHVIESPAVWEYFDEALAPRRPSLVVCPDPNTGRSRHRWLIDGKLFPKPDGKGSVGLACPPLSEKEAAEGDWACKTLVDPATRLTHASRMGVETQVIYPTTFLAYLTDDPQLDVALAHAYNRYMADVWSKGENQLRWVAVPPLHSIDATIEELNFAKQHGAVGVFFRGMEGERSLGDPYFYPVYQEASRLDLPICVHTGAGNPTLMEACDTRYTAFFSHIRLLPLMAFHDLVNTKVPERFPDLRFGFVESCASWVPFLIHFLNRFKTRRNNIPGQLIGPQLCRDYRMYVACEADEDIPYLLQQIGEDNLIIGSDYGHHDQSWEPELVQAIRGRDDIPAAIADKMLCENPRRFYPL